MQKLGESEVTSVTVSLPRRGGAKGFPGFSPSLSGLVGGGKNKSMWAQALSCPCSPSLSSALAPSMLGRLPPLMLHSLPSVLWDQPF